MRKVLLALMFCLIAVAPVQAEEIFGGDLQLVEEFSIAPGGFEPAVIVSDYSNVTTFTGVGFANGGVELQGANSITRLVADDIVPTGVHGGLSVVQWTFTVVNLNAEQVSIRPRVRFYQADGVAGAPGTLITGFSFNPVVMGAATASFFNSIAAFPMPAGPFWAGITFDDNNGTTGITAAQLEMIGQAVFDPPTIGSSADLLFQTAAAGSFLANNPAGATGSFGTPRASFGWRFNVDEPVPVNSASWGRVKAQYRD